MQHKVSIVLHLVTSSDMEEELKEPTLALINWWPYHMPTVKSTYPETQLVTYQLGLSAIRETLPRQWVPLIAINTKVECCTWPSRIALEHPPESPMLMSALPIDFRASRKQPVFVHWNLLTFTLGRKRNGTFIIDPVNGYFPSYLDYVYCAEVSHPQTLRRTSGFGSWQAFSGSVSCLTTSHSSPARLQWP